jgi:Protein of unknown function (DUF1553)/Protein of unknown function (DUF1549)/Planctomycete cytochrome C
MKSPALRHAPIVALLAAILLLAGAAVSQGSPTPDSQELQRTQAPDFNKQIAPLLVQRCLDCHSGPKPKGSLDLSRREKALAGGNQGPVLVPGRADQSLLWEFVAQNKMPPKRPLTAAEKALLHAWIEGGAHWSSDPIDPFRVTTDKRAGVDWWALQSVVKPTIPSAGKSSWGQNPIDAFILAKLRAKGLSPSPPADRGALIRRLSFDLLGLPPTPSEVVAFVHDDSPDAYDKLVNRYLDSSRYGVRWARHWLDVVRFGESNGFEHDEFRPNAWPYRDWVVDALNGDMRYDEFARLQLAGDLLHAEDPESLAATGFLVAGSYDSVGQTQQSEAMRKVVRQDEMEDIVGTVGQTFLGLTVQCARCHDHKFDPVRQVEYYRLVAALSGVRHGERPLPHRESALGDSKLPRLGTAINSGPKKVYAVVPRQPEAMYVLAGGDSSRPGPIAAAGAVAALGGLNAEFNLTANANEGERRRKLAEWITSPKNPLFARVMVNRLWHYHFGTGLVETPNDFGFNGGRPSHAELLDWLAADFMEQQCSLKSLHRLIVTSATYRQASAFNENAARLDADNRLLWRHRPHRLEAEAVRDAALSVAGQLNERMGGPGYQEFRLKNAPGTTTNNYESADSVGLEFNRRTLYRAWARGGRNKLLDTLDCPDPSTTAPRRAVTTTPQQALALMNDAFILRLSKRFAERIKREAGPDKERQIQRAYQLAYGRLANAEEIAIVRNLMKNNGLEVLARALFNSNEFLYVD